MKRQAEPKEMLDKDLYRIFVASLFLEVYDFRMQPCSFAFSRAGAGRCTKTLTQESVLEAR